MGEMWSSEMLRNAPTATPTPSMRPYLSAWLDASITSASAPVEAAQAMWRCRSRGSGVVSAAGSAVVPSSSTMVEKRGQRARPRRSARASRMDRRQKAVVVLPRVPVTAHTAMRPEGWSQAASASMPMACRMSVTSSMGAPMPAIGDSAT